MSSYGGFGTPGQGAALLTTEREIIAQGMGVERCYIQDSCISGAARDAGNSPTTLLRSGLLLGKITSSGKLIEWVATATDGSQDIAGILRIETRAQDFNATNTDRVFSTLISGPLSAANLLIQGVALVGHVDEFLARRMLAAAGCMLDDDPMGLQTGRVIRTILASGTTLTPTGAQNGTRFLMSNAASVTVTLPVIGSGLVYEFVRVADEEFIVASPTADNIVIGNDLSADSVTFTTAGEQIGATVRVESVYLSGTLKWLMTLPPPPFGTGTATLTYAVAS